MINSETCACTECGSPLPGGARFCPACGKPVASPPPAPVVTPPGPGSNFQLTLGMFGLPPPGVDLVIGPVTLQADQETGTSPDPGADLAADRESTGLPK